MASESSACVVCCKCADWWVVSPCGHDAVCAECVVRSRVHFSQRFCSLCKQDGTGGVVVPAGEHAPFAVLCSRALQTDESVGLRFASAEALQFVANLRAIRCPACEAVFSSHDLLKEHVRSVHDRYFCDVCLRHRKAFTWELTLYSAQELGHHVLYGPPESIDARKGHPQCDFCQLRFLDGDHLYEHMVMSHHSCHLCDRAGVRFVYYRDYEELATHFRREHFACSEPECVERRYVVFATAVDLRVHQLRRHPPASAVRRRGTVLLTGTPPLLALRSGRAWEQQQQPESQQQRQQQQQPSEPEPPRLPPLPPGPTRAVPAAPDARQQAAIAQLRECARDEFAFNRMRTLFQRAVAGTVSAASLRRAFVRLPRASESLWEALTECMPALAMRDDMAAARATQPLGAGPAPGGRGRGAAGARALGEAEAEAAAEAAVSALTATAVRFFAALHALLAGDRHRDGERGGAGDGALAAAIRSRLRGLPVDALLDFRWARACGLSDAGATVLARALETFDREAADPDAQGRALRHVLAQLGADDARVAGAYAAEARDRVASGGDAADSAADPG